MSGSVRGQFARRGASHVVVDARSGEVVRLHDARVARTAMYIYNWSEPLHFGDFAGWPVKVLYLLLGLASSFLPVSGYLLWHWKTFRTRTPSASREMAAVGG